MDVRKIVSANMRAYRKLLGLSQEKLAELCGCSRQYISKLEQMRTDIGVDKLDRVCRALNIKPVQLFAEFNESGYLLVGQPRAVFVAQEADPDDVGANDAKTSNAQVRSAKTYAYGAKVDDANARGVATRGAEATGVAALGETNKSLRRTIEYCSTLENGPLVIEGENGGASLVVRGDEGVLESINVPSQDGDIAVLASLYLYNKGYRGKYLTVRLQKALPELVAVFRKYS